MSRRRRGRNPLYRMMKTLLGGDDSAATTARILFDAGITAPEELERIRYADLRSVRYLGDRGLARANSARLYLIAQKNK